MSKDVAPMAAPTVGEDFPLDRFTDDVARKIWEYSDIARRYSLTDEQMRYLVGRPEIRRAIKTKREIWESDSNIIERFRTLSCVGMLEKLPAMLSMLGDTKVSPDVQVKLFTAVAKITGAEAPPPARGDILVPTGPQFAVNIHFSGGRTETIITQPMPALSED